MRYFILRLKSYYILRGKVITFRVNNFITFCVDIITFCVGITFCGDYYILRRNNLQSYLTDKLSVCPYTWESFKTTLKDATNNTFEKRQKRIADWLDENNTEIQNVLKDKNLSRREIQKRIRQMKNGWFTRKAKKN